MTYNFSIEQKKVRMQYVGYVAAVHAIIDNIEKLNDACANCHKVYRDVATAEGGGLGGDRCR